mmetsp:Transcript_25375/g.55418  ORF Transcript_25375/g.55418 Transcript_25375/m.55418 type:complete len:208 (+) Transcript_25375:688-1311(+)
MAGFQLVYAHCGFGLPARPGAGQVGADGRLSVDAQKRGSTAAGAFGPALAGGASKRETGAPVGDDTCLSGGGLQHCLGEVHQRLSTLRGPISAEQDCELCEAHRFRSRRAIVDGLCLRHRHGALLCLSGLLDGSLLPRWLSDRYAFEDGPHLDVLQQGSASITLGNTSKGGAPRRTPATETLLQKDAKEEARSANRGHGANDEHHFC